MIPDLLSAKTEFKLYKDKAIWVGTFIGGPLVAGYLIANNYKNLGQDRNASKSWGYSIGSTMILFGLAILAPHFENVRSPLIPLVYTATASFLYKIFQARQVVSHINSGGQIYSTWRAAWAGIVDLFIMLIIISSIIFVTQRYS